MNRTGYNILGEFLNPPSGDKRPALLTHLRAYRPAVLTIMDNPSFAVEAWEATGGQTMVIHRHYHTNEGYLFTQMSADEYANHITYNRTLDNRLWPQVWNEPATAPERLPELLRKTIDVADILTGWGYRGVLGNLGTATIQLETIASGVFDEYLTRLALWSTNEQHIAAYHEYTAILAPFGIGFWSINDLKDPAKMQLENWPEIDDTQLQNLMALELGRALNWNPFIIVPPESEHYWHIRRLEWLQDRAVLIGVGRHQYVITEGFLDRMGDVSAIYAYLEQTYGVVSDWEIKGAPTLEKVWKAYWPQWSRDEALAQQCWWLERNYDSDCLGWCLFCICWDAHLEQKDQKWETGYNIGGWMEFQHLMVDYRDKPAKPEPPGPTPEPPPDDPDNGGTVPEPIPTYELMGCHPVSWLYQLLGKNAAQVRAQRTELYPGWEAWLFPLFLFVCVTVAITALISSIQPHVAAQGANPMEGIISIQQAGELLVAMVAAIIAGGSSSVVFTPLVNLVKFLLKAVGQEGLISANGINILVSGGVVLVAFFSRYLGVELQAQSLMEWLAGVIPLVITGIALFTGNKYMYSYAQKIEMPVFNYKRS